MKSLANIAFCSVACCMLGVSQASAHGYPILLEPRVPGTLLSGPVAGSEVLRDGFTYGLLLTQSDHGLRMQLSIANLGNLERAVPDQLRETCTFAVLAADRTLWQCQSEQRLVTRTNGKPAPRVRATRVLAPGEMLTYEVDWPGVANLAETPAWCDWPVTLQVTLDGLAEPLVLRSLVTTTYRGTPRHLVIPGDQEAWIAEVPTDHWAYSVASHLQDGGVLQGFPAGYFSGEEALARDDFCQATERLVELASQEPLPPSIVMLVEALKFEFVELGEI